VRDKITKRRRGKEGVEWGGPLATEERLYVDICAVPRVPSYANANGAFLSKSQATPGQRRLLVFCDVKCEKNEYHVITTPNVT